MIIHLQCRVRCVSGLKFCSEFSVILTPCTYMNKNIFILILEFSFDHAAGQWGTVS